MKDVISCCQWFWGRGFSLFILAFLFLLLVSCDREPAGQRIDETSAAKASDSSSSIHPERSASKRPRSDEYLRQRQRMAELIRDDYGFTDERVLAVMATVPRHWFVPADYQERAYVDSPLPIGHGQTISQPFIVAYMTSLLSVDENKTVLEVGTGLGYQAAVLSELVSAVYTIEIVEPLGKRAAQIFQEHGYLNIHAKVGDGYKGWPEHAPFDGIVVTCAPDHIPPDLIKQLKPGGVMVIPVGDRFSAQELVVVTKDGQGNLHKESKLPVRFVPLTRQGTD